MNTTTTRTADLREGDLITELDTPEGPFYRVAKVTPKSFYIDLGYGQTLRMGIRPTAAVLVQV